MKLLEKLFPLKLLNIFPHSKPTLSTKLPGIYKDIGDNHGVIYANSQSELISQIEPLISRKKN